ncbi:MAG: glycosyltransferase family 2 protein [Planctomycetota bacterium]|nr:glycosyltransferase family 2 protein [Planctomycetota bacterium]
MRVSIILPTYNCCGLLREAVACVLDQDLRDWELLVVDDGSTDATRQTVESLGDERIRYCRQEHRGVYVARNAGLDLAGGRYVAWLDSDDLWPREFLRVMADALEAAGDCGVAYCPMVNLYPDGRRREPARYLKSPSGRVTRAFFQRSRLFLPCMVMRREALGEMRFDESLLTLGDLDLGLRLTCRMKFLFVPGVRLTRRVRRGSLSQHVSCEQLDINKVRVLERFYRHLGGAEHVPHALAMRVLAKAWRDAAAEFYRYGAWSAAARLYARAMARGGLSPSAWLGWAKARLKGAATDAMPDWQEPPALPPLPARGGPEG